MRDKMTEAKILYRKRLLATGLKSVGNFAFFDVAKSEAKRNAKHYVHNLRSKHRYKYAKSQGDR